MAKKGSVLVVEDKGIVARDIASMVRGLGYTVPATAGTYEEAVEKAGKHSPDLALMDIKLKGKKDGIDAAGVLLEKHNIPSIFLTAYSDPDTVDRAKETGPYGFIIKPLQEKALEVELELAFHRLMAERSLRQTESRLQALLDAAEDYIFLIDKKHRISYVNTAGAEALGKDPGDIMGKPVKDLFSKEVYQRQESNIKKVFRTGESVYVESRYPIGGKDIWLSALLAPVKGAQGEITDILGISRDISDRIQAEEELGQQHELFSTVMDRYPEYLYVADTETYEILFVNRKLRNLAGTDMVGGKCHKEFYGLEEPCTFCTNEMIMNSKLPHVWENYNEHLGRHLLLTDQIIKWPDGRDVRFETAIDITDQKKIEKVLEASEKKYRSFIEHSAYGFVIMDPRGRITYLNKAGREISGVEEKDLPLDFNDIMSQEDVERASANLEKISAGEDMEAPGVYTIIRKDGENRIVEVQTLPIFKEGELAGFHGTVYDVTENARYREELKEKTEFLDSVIQNTTDGIFVIDDDFRYRLINPAAGRIVGHDPEKWIGQRAGKYRHPDDEEASIGAVMKALSGEPSSCDVRVRDSEGDYKLLNIKYSLMQLGESMNILGLVNDITEKKRSEEALRASEEKYRSLFEHSPEAIIILDLEGKITECNNSTIGLMELKFENIIGHRFDELGIIDSTQADRYVNILKSMAEGLNLDVIEVELIMNHGRPKWIEVFPSLISQSGRPSGIQIIARDITDRKIAEIEMRKKLMKFELEGGNIYLSKESRADQSIEAFKELLMVGYSGILISRRSRKDYQSSIGYMFNHVRISEMDKDSHVLPEYNAIHDLLTGLPRGEVVHIDCIEYLISRIGPKKTLNIIHYLKDLATSKNLCVLISADPTAMSEVDMRLIEKESENILPSKSLPRISPKLSDTLAYIEKMNKEGIMPSYSDIGEYFHLSKPTIRTRIRQLEELGTVKEIRLGRKKALELTEKGKNYLAV